MEPSTPTRPVSGLGAPPWIVGHRGAPVVATENTVASLRAAVELGVDAVELDVQLTADGEPVVVHDWSLQRLAGSPLVVERATVRDLAGIEVRDPLLLVPPQPIRSLAEVLAALPRDLPLNVELKRREADPRRMPDAVLEQIGGRSGVWVSSFDWELLAALRRRAPDLPLAPLTWRRIPGFEMAATELGAVALHCATRVVSRALIRRTRAAGRPLLVYPVNDPRQARTLVALEVAGLITDDPARIRTALRGDDRTSPSQGC